MSVQLSSVLTTDDQQDVFEYAGESIPDVEAPADKENKNIIVENMEQKVAYDKFFGKYIANPSM